MSGDLTLIAVGDVLIDRDTPESMFESTGEMLRSADITFGNCEVPYSETGVRNPVARGALISHPRNVPALRTAAGFDVMSFANNHALDQGYDAFFRTLEVLRENGIEVCGAGRDPEEARQPAIIERDGVRVAFLAYCSILFLGYDADVGRPGVSPLRIHTVYEHLEEEQPGTPPVIHTYPVLDDLEAMQEDVRRAKEACDVVVFTCHWGLHMVPESIAAYERTVARAAIDAGADIVIGHHAHILKGIDTYRGKVIFHNLANFAFDLPVMTEQAPSSPRLLPLFERYKDHYGYSPDYPRYPFSVDARKTMIAKAAISGGGITRVSFLPCHIDADNRPILLSPSDEMFGEVVEYVGRISSGAGLRSSLRVEGNEVVVEATS